MVCGAHSWFDRDISGPYQFQGSGYSSATQNSNGEQKSRDDAGGLNNAKKGRPPPENLRLTQQQHPALQAEAGSPVRITAPKRTPAGATVVGSRKSNGSSRNSLVDAEWARNGLEREVGMAGTRLLQVTKSDLSRAPFHAPPEVSRKFLRSLRILRLHAFAAAAIKRCGAAWKQHGNVNDAKRYAEHKPLIFLE